MDLVIRNVTAVDPQGLREHVDICVDAGRILWTGPTGLASHAPREIDGTGLHAFPAFADMHCHFRLDGPTVKNDIYPGTVTASQGGFTDVCLMPDTQPPVDSAALVEDIVKLSAAAPCRVHPIGCVTRSMRGEKLVRMRKMAGAGAIAFSDNGRPVQSMEILLAAMAESFENGYLLMTREQASDSRIGTRPHDEAREERRDKTGVGPESEESMFSRDLFVTEKRGGRMHFCDVSTASDLALVRGAKQRRVRGVTCSTSPRLYAASGPGVPGAPPVDKAIVKALMDGTIDCITTDKRLEGVRTGQLAFPSAFSYAMTYLFQPGVLGLARISALMSANPRRLLGLAGGRIKEGEPADIAICDVRGPSGMRGPDGRPLVGSVRATLRAGVVTYSMPAN